MLAFVFALWTTPAHATENSAYIAPFFAEDAEAEEIAQTLPEALLEELLNEPKVVGLGLSQMQPVHDMPAEMYVTSCPPEEFVGCTFVLAESSEVPYAVVGQVTSLQSGHRAQVTIIEVSTAREALVLSLDIAEGGTEAFAVAVTRSLIGVMEGTIGQEEDLRLSEGGPSGYNEEEAYAVDDYTRESGGAEAVEEKVNVELEQKVITEEDLEFMKSIEGSKEWDRLGMTPREYMRYFNSGMSLSAWKALSNGRKGQVLARVGLGATRSPINGKYYGRIAKSNIDLSAIDSYAWQSLESGTGFDVAGSVSYGILPFVDIGVKGGFAAGGFELDIHSFVINQHSAVPPAETYPQTTTYVGGQALYTPLYFNRIKPVVGGEVLFWMSSDMNFDFGEEVYPYLPPARFLTVGGLVGGEIKITDNLDLFAHVPVSAVVFSSNAPVDYQAGGNVLTVDGDPADVSTVLTPQPFSRLVSGINVGVQIRIPVVKEREFGSEMYE